MAILNTKNGIPDTKLELSALALQSAGTANGSAIDFVALEGMRLIVNVTVVATGGTLDLVLQGRVGSTGSWVAVMDVPQIDAVGQKSFPIGDYCDSEGQNYTQYRVVKVVGTADVTHGEWITV